MHKTLLRSQMADGPLQRIKLSLDGAGFRNADQQQLCLQTLLGIALAMVGAVAAQAQYIYTTFDAPLAAPGGGTYATGISGTNIVGYYLDASFTAHGFLHGDSAYITLDDPLAMSALYGGGGTFPAGVSGPRVVGYYTSVSYLDEFQQESGFLLDGGAYVTLSNALALQGSTFVQAVCGVTVVGYYSENQDQVKQSFHAFLNSGSSWTTLDDPLAGSGVNQGTFAKGISGANVVGYYLNNDAVCHGFLYNGSTWTTFDHPLGTGGTFATGISGGNVVGCYTCAALNSRLCQSLPPNRRIAETLVPSQLKWMAGKIRDGRFSY